MFSFSTLNFLFFFFILKKKKKKTSGNNDIKLLKFHYFFNTQFRVDATTHKHEKDSLIIHHQGLKDQISKMISRKLKKFELESIKKTLFDTQF